MCAVVGDTKYEGSILLCSYFDIRYSLPTWYSKSPGMFMLLLKDGKLSGITEICISE